MNHDPASLTVTIKAEAQRSGFDLVGVTTPTRPDHYDVFEGWLAQGRHGEMAYLATQRSRLRRSQPLEILPQCHSILVLGFPYPAAASEQGGEEAVELPRGRVATYALCDDYHDVLGEKLAALVAFIEAQVGGPVPNRWYTDTGPVLERDLAQRAGLGWAGKNTCLIHPGKGSYLLLAEILLGLELVPDPPFTTDQCGSCTRCIEACPTRCILPDRTIDARRCISYLTIELKGAIPADLRPQIGGWVFGCDVCQQVCPWNIRFASESPVEADLRPRPGVSSPNLIDELALTPQAFNQKFKGSPVKRAKRRGYLRNVAVALGNSKNPAAVSALGRALREDPEPLVRGHAAWALGQIGGEQARGFLVIASAVETDPGVLGEVRSALEHLSMLKAGKIG